MILCAVFLYNFPALVGCIPQSANQLTTDNPFSAASFSLVITICRRQVVSSHESFVIQNSHSFCSEKLELNGIIEFQDTQKHLIIPLVLSFSQTNFVSMKGSMLEEWQAEETEGLSMWNCCCRVTGSSLFSTFCNLERTRKL